MGTLSRTPQDSPRRDLGSSYRIKPACRWGLAGGEGVSSMSVSEGEGGRRLSTVGRRYDTTVGGRGGLAGRAGDGGSGLAETLIGHLGYLGIALLLVLGGLGLPVPE